jgi:glycosyltransferase involved in cell wall biosynthesis
MDLDNQVTVLNRFVDVNSVLAGVHASITLANSPGIVKSYPHSLLESLAAGKPVLVSRAIPMADYVEQTGCGRVVDSVSPTHILAAIESLAAKYATLRESAQEVGHRDFSEDRLVDSSRDMYERVLGHSSCRDQGSR